MRRALRAALRGRGHASPNPLVGAVWTDGTDWLTAHFARFGGPHAEARLFPRLPHRPAGDLYLTLEPCTVHGKTPPCIDLLLRRPPRRVFVATPDPDPRVSGRGIERLRAAGIEVVLGEGAWEAVALNLPFFFAHLKRRAWIEVKVGTSLDARVATGRGESRWVTGEAARIDVHRRRSGADAVVVGAGTVLTDDPELTVRHVKGPEPSKIVIDSSFRTPVESRLWRSWQASWGTGHGPWSQTLGNHIETEGGWKRRPRLILAAGQGGDPGRAGAFRERGWEVWPLPLRNGHVSLEALARRAAREGLQHLFVEPGPSLSGALFTADLVDELTLYVAPRVLGGSRSWSGDFEAATLASAPRWTRHDVRQLGEDLRIGLRRMDVIEEFLSCSPGWSKRSGSSNASGATKRGRN